MCFRKYDRLGWRLLLTGLLVLWVVGACTGAPPTAPTTPPDMAETQSGAATEPVSLANARQRMVSETIEGRGVSDPAVLAAMRSVPRHRFVPDAYLAQAYADHPLPIGYGQTISQPYIVAWMTELLEVQPGEKVLEIGTGSGYQAAVLAEMGVEVYTMEIVPELAASAADRLQALGYTNVHVRQGDGYYGWLEHGLYDAIIVTAAPDHLPSPLVTQLVDGGRLVIPIGPRSGFQSLWKFEYTGGELQAANLGGVAFVPFTGEGVQSFAGETTPTP